MSELTAVCEWGAPRDIREALEQVIATRDVGATYAKWQLIAPQRLASSYARRYWSEKLGGCEFQRETFEQVTPLKITEWQQLMKHCKQHGIKSMVTPFWVGGISLLEAAGVDAYKIASGDVTYYELIRAASKTGKPLAISTGASQLHEVNRALDWLDDAANPITLLACDLLYPCGLGDAFALKLFIAELAEKARKSDRKFQVGYSDHTEETITGVIAVTSGATMVEKHVTLTPNGSKPDDKMALTVGEMRNYIRMAEKAHQVKTARYNARALGVSYKEARRGAYAKRHLVAGQQLTADVIDYLRPCPPDVIPPSVNITRQRVNKEIPAGEPITWRDITSDEPTTLYGCK